MSLRTKRPFPRFIAALVQAGRQTIRRWKVTICRRDPTRETDYDATLRALNIWIWTAFGPNPFARLNHCTALPMFLEPVC